MFGSLLKCVYPALCRHCEAPLEESSHLLCPLCREHLVLCDPDHRCRFCFRATQGKTICSECIEHPFIYKRYAAALEDQGPCRTLLSEYQKNAPQLFKALGSLMAMQVLQLNWKLPDLIVPMPGSKGEVFKRGYDCHLLLAEQIGKILERPKRELLVRSFSFQMWLDETICFHLKKRSEVCDQRLLLVIDRFEKEQVRAACSALIEAFPLEIDVISLV